MLPERFELIDPFLDRCFEVNRFKCFGILGGMKDLGDFIGDGVDLFTRLGNRISVPLPFHVGDIDPQA